MSVTGVDIGYQTCLIAAPRAGGIEVLLNDYTGRQTASVVSFTEKQRFIGESARTKFVTNFKNTIGGFKHLLGRQYKDADVQAELARWGYRHQEMPDGTVGVVVSHLRQEKVLSVVQIVAMMLVKLREFAESNLKGKVPNGVIGVPVWFTDAQRHALLDACKVANFHCLKLFNETSAVALAYGIYKQDLPAEGETPRRVVFVDFGHSQLQISAAEFVKGKLTILATAADQYTGGRSFDLLLVEHFSKIFKDKYKLDVKSNPRAALRLEQECEKLKKQMSSYAQALPLNIECFMEDKDVSGKMARDEFEALAAPLLARVEATIAQLLKVLGEAGVTPADIYAVETVGGASRIPAVRAMLTKAFGKELSTTLNSDEPVARGCALIGAIISPTFRVREFAVHEKTPYAMSLTWAGKGGEEKTDSTFDVFSANSFSHLSKILSFQRSGPFEFAALYKDAAAVPGGHPQIAHVKIDGVTPSFDGESQKVKVKVKLDEHGCFAVDSATLMDKLPPAPEGDAAAAGAAAAAPAAGAAKSAEPAKDAAQPMDTDSADKEEDAAVPASVPAAAASDAKEGEKKEEEQPKKKAKTHRSVNLNVTTLLPSALSPETVTKYTEEELDMQSQDRLEVEKSIARNALEEYIYDMRDKIHSLYEEFIKPEEKDTFTSKLDTTLDWLSGGDADDETKTVYVEKLNELRGTSRPVEARHSEAALRPEAETALRQTIVRLRRFVDEARGGDEKYNHIDPKQVDKVAAEVDARDAWLNEKMGEQQRKAKYDPPVVLSAAINTQREELERLATPIVNTPKPKVEPPKDEKKEEKKEEVKKEEGAPAAAAAAGAEGAQAEPAKMEEA